MAEEKKEVAPKAKAVKKAPAKKAAVAKKAAAPKKEAAPKKAPAKKAAAKKVVKEAKEVKEVEKVETVKAEEVKPAKEVKAAAPKAEEAKPVEKEVASFKTRKANIKDFDIILGPVVTEKTQALQVSNNTMTFKVRSDATASMVKSAVQSVFGVKVDKVNIVNVRPRDKRSTKYAGTIPGFKKAYVKINKDYNLGEIAKASQSEVK